MRFFEFLLLKPQNLRNQKLNRDFFFVFSSTKPWKKFSKCDLCAENERYISSFLKLGVVKVLPDRFRKSYQYFNRKHTSHYKTFEKILRLSLQLGEGKVHRSKVVKFGHFANFPSTKSKMKMFLILFK